MPLRRRRGRCRWWRRRLETVGGTKFMGSIPNINSRARPSVCVWVLSCKITITFRANISRPQLEIAWHLIVKLFSSFAIIAKSHLLLLHRRLMTPSNSIHPALPPPIPASQKLIDQPVSQSVRQLFPFIALNTLRLRRLLLLLHIESLLSVQSKQSFCFSACTSSSATALNTFPNTGWVIPSKRFEYRNLSFT